MTGTLRQAAAGYLQTRRSLGYQLQAHGRLLNSYIADLEASGQTTVTAANAVAWATRPAAASPVWHARRLSVARCFARHLSATDPSCQVPPAWLLYLTLRFRGRLTAPVLLIQGVFYVAYVGYVLTKL